MAVATICRAIRANPVVNLIHPSVAIVTCSILLRGCLLHDNYVASSILRNYPTSHPSSALLAWLSLVSAYLVRNERDLPGCRMFSVSSVPSSQTPECWPELTIFSRSGQCCLLRRKTHRPSSLTFFEAQSLQLSLSAR